MVRKWILLNYDSPFYHIIIYSLTHWLLFACSRNMSILFHIFDWFSLQLTVEIPSKISYNTFFFFSLCEQTIVWFFQEEFVDDGCCILFDASNRWLIEQFGGGMFGSLIAFYTCCLCNHRLLFQLGSISLEKGANHWRHSSLSPAHRDGHQRSTDSMNICSEWWFGANRAPCRRLVVHVLVLYPTAYVVFLFAFIIECLCESLTRCASVHRVVLVVIARIDLSYLSCNVIVFGEIVSVPSPGVSFHPTRCISDRSSSSVNIPIRPLLFALFGGGPWRVTQLYCHTHKSWCITFFNRISSLPILGNLSAICCSFLFNTRSTVYSICCLLTGFDCSWFGEIRKKCAILLTGNDARNSICAQTQFLLCDVLEFDWHNHFHSPFFLSLFLMPTQCYIYRFQSWSYLRNWSSQILLC
jgi:hypothetical protein